MFEEKAMSCVKKICKKNCIAPYPCAHDRERKDLDAFGKGDVCPLEKYKVVHKEETRPFYQIPYQESHPSKEELFAVCANCDYGRVVEMDDGYFIERDIAFMEYCIDCPVLMIEENMLEAMAEFMS